jgi:hypothetical protein
MLFRHWNFRRGAERARCLDVNEVLPDHELEFGVEAEVENAEKGVYPDSDGGDVCVYKVL